ncbi:hypothetical protein ACFL3S_11950 [Gemmatimonadota bacterium]
MASRCALDPGSWTRPTICILAVLLTGQPPLRGLGQTPPDTAPHLPIATLNGWADEVWLALTDRDGSYLGRLAEQGTFQRFNPLMDPEYELDVRTSLFTPSEDARWASVGEGFRAAGASINHPFILNLVDWREEIPVSGSVNLRARYHRHRSLTAQRDYTRLGLLWRGVFGSGWNLETGLGVHFFKPSADVDLILGRTWANPGGRRWDLRLRVAALDAFNNMIFNGLGVGEDEVEAHLDYLRSPVAGRLALQSDSDFGRVEIHGGITNRSEVRVTFPGSGAVSYTLKECVGFGGILAEVTPAPSLALAAFAAWARAETDRRHDLPGEGDFTLKEETLTVGFRQRVRTGQRVSLEVDVAAIWRPEDRSGIDGPLVRHRDREIFGMLALASVPAPGFAWRFVLAGLDRDAGELTPDLTAGNLRNVLEWGYRFASGFHVMAGLRWDLDRFSRYPFDGGHLRISSSW